VRVFKVKRPIAILLTGGLLLASCYQLLPIVLDKLLLPSETVGEQDPYFGGNRERSNGMAPLALWWAVATDTQGKEYFRKAKAQQIVIIKGFAFIDDKMLPTKTITEYLNQKVASKEIAYVVLLPANDTKWGDLIPIIDECRKSHVRSVLLNYFEIP
jgi:hypothetical protein